MTTQRGLTIYVSNCMGSAPTMAPPSQVFGLCCVERDDYEPGAGAKRSLRSSPHHIHPSTNERSRTIIRSAIPDKSQSQVIRRHTENNQVTIYPVGPDGIEL